MFRTHSVSLLFCVWALSVGRACDAARPFSSDDAGTVSAGEYEVEVSADYWHDAASLALCMKHGLTDRMDLGVALGRCVLPERERAYHGAEVSMKFSLVRELLSASFAGCLAHAAYGVNLVLSKRIRFYSFHVNAGYAAVAFTDDADVTYGLVNEFAIGRVSLGGEISGTHTALDWWLVGGRVGIFEWLAIDAGIGGDFASPDALTANTGFWLTFPVSKEER